MDAHIYSYYSNNILGPKYEEILSKDINLSNCINAYRRIPVEGGTTNKCNIHFARDVFNFIKGKECIAFTLDITSFFDSLNQKYLKEQWCKLIGKETLPPDHYNIFKSLTRFAYVEMGNPYKNKKGLLTIFRIKHINDLRRDGVQAICDSPKEFREKVVKTGLIKTNSKDKKGNKIKDIKGIPQGTALSAFLANLYMLEFDKKLYNEVEVKFKGLYRRYSDDIVIICAKNDYEYLEQYIHRKIQDYHLDIQKEKTRTWIFKKENEILKSFELVNGEEVSNRSLQYLGFEFDGVNILLKSTSIAKYYRNLKRLIRAKANRASRYKKTSPQLRRIYRKQIYRRFTHLGTGCKKRNYINYIIAASKILEEPKIRKQLSRSWFKIQKEIKRYESNYKLFS